MKPRHSFVYVLYMGFGVRIQAEKGEFGQTLQIILRIFCFLCNQRLWASWTRMIFFIRAIVTGPGKHLSLNFMFNFCGHKYETQIYLISTNNSVPFYTPVIIWLIVVFNHCPSQFSDLFMRSPTQWQTIGPVVGECYFISLFVMCDPEIFYRYSEYVVLIWV